MKRKLSNNAPNTPTKKNKNVDELDSIFEKYSKGQLYMDGEGIFAFTRGNFIFKFNIIDLNLDVMDISIIILFYKLNCTEKYKIYTSEFLRFRELNIFSFQEMKEKIPRFKQELKSQKYLKKFYEFCFKYFKEPNQKIISYELAVDIWKLLDKFFRYNKEWCEFILTRHKKSITLDQFKQYLEFTIEGIESYNHEYSSYPIIIDDFVEFKKSKSIK